MYPLNSDRIKSVSPLSNDQIKDIAPSAFATAPKDDVSSRYTFVPTIDVIDVMRSQDWLPVQAQEMRANNTLNVGFQKHLIKFQNTNLEFNGEALQAVLINSHNRSCAYQFHVGVFRFACLNGMIVGDTFKRISVKHVGLSEDDIIGASKQIIVLAPGISNSINEMKEIELTPDQQGVFAKYSIKALYPDLDVYPLRPEQVLYSRRRLDDGPQLWKVFNRVQENVTKGGIKGQFPGKRDKRRTREIKSIDRNVKVNKDIWNLAEEMKKELRALRNS